MLRQLKNRLKITYNDFDTELLEELENAKDIVNHIVLTNEEIATDKYTSLLENDKSYINAVISLADYEFSRAYDNAVKLTSSTPPGFNQKINILTKKLGYWRGL